VDDSVPEQIIHTLRELKTEVVHCPAWAWNSGYFWRFLVADDRGFPHWLVRDADSRLNIRERLAVDEWLRSGRAFHVIRDHPHHNMPVMGCGFGGRRRDLRMEEQIRAWPQRTNYQDDERFLEAICWPTWKEDCLVHDGCYPEVRWGEKEVHPFPTAREFGRYVGERCHEDEHWKHGDRDVIFRA
jgi:hypothetical protein